MSAAAQEQLAQECARIASVCGEALTWVQDPGNGDLLGAEARSLIRLMRQSARRSGRLSRSARTRMSVSVFGPSQAGKSFLVSVLARPENGRLVADFEGPDGQLDYIRQINPEGEGESTGLVTRFTMDRAPTPAGFPIRLNLLSEADIARTLINSFFMDGDRSEPVPEPGDIAAHLDQFKARAGAVQPGLDEDDVHEIAEYIDSHFGREAYAAALRPLWEDAAQILPGLSRADRAAFLSLLWGGHAPFCELYLTLADALAQLDHASQAFAGLDALVPREASIIDVKTLGGAADGTPLTVTTEQGRQATLPRSVICGLAAELVLPMRDLPSQIFADTDLLDFPGARNRFEQDLSKAFESPDKLLPELLLRGKVAYLFDRYVEDQEITSMLLCIPDSNMETVDLPGLVQNWIAKTHGPNAEARRAADCVLFMVLTKFDKHLSDSAAEGGDETRFDRRMQASLLEKFGKGSDNWVTEWQPGQSFDNCFWLRNPNYYVDGLIDYDEDRRELRLRPEKETRLGELRAGCVQAPAVQRHFASPEAAWDAALSLNDGGVSYLAQHIEKVCKPDSKLVQIRAQLQQVVGELARAMAPFHVSDDVEKRIAEKQDAAARVIDDLEQVLARHRFGALVSALMVDQEEIEGRISRVPNSIRITNAVNAAEGGSAGLQRPGRPAQRAESAGDGIRTMTLEQFQAETAMEAWIEGMKALRSDAMRLSAYGIGEGTSGDLVAELIQAARRTDLSDRTADMLREVNFGLTVEKQAQPASILGAEAINGFVSTLGMQDVTEADRPKVQESDGGERAIFVTPAPSDSADDLPQQPRPTAQSFWTDWVFGLDAMFVANAKDGLGGQVDVDQNLALGRILGALNGQGG
ncbi:putative virulence factor [Ruegeria sp. 2012CJ41-6]|uniref:Virulence factor n=1 Tax=Ruegeria spongiae TaxID=2942209 RepID=A0ABT0Q279_9RHOB|nr:virulence factor SrfC family protein [Ruegeria spongiae]MCL6283941.1 putative virulence factor [Ruegeria spongiae]